MKSFEESVEYAKERVGVYFIAEIGQNHQGDIKIAKQMVDSLVNTGVSAIKTVKRDLDTCLTEKQKSMIYDNPNSFGKTYLEHRQFLEFTEDEFCELKEYSEKRGFDFLSSFTDEISLQFLDSLDMDALKIASQRVFDIKLLESTAKTNRPIILSTGMSDMDMVSLAVDTFKNNDLYLLQCTSSYPCVESDINLNVINTYKTTFPECRGYGFSGHHIGIAPDLTAFVMGVDIIERHYTLNRSWKGTDHFGSLEKPGVVSILKYIEQMRISMGSHNKEILDCELGSIRKLRGL